MLLLNHIQLYLNILTTYPKVIFSSAGKVFLLMSHPNHPTRTQHVIVTIYFHFICTCHRQRVCSGLASSPCLFKVWYSYCYTYFSDDPGDKYDVIEVDDIYSDDRPPTPPPPRREGQATTSFGPCDSNTQRNMSLDASRAVPTVIRHSAPAQVSFRTQHDMDDGYEKPISVHANANQSMQGKLLIGNTS